MPNPVRQGTNSSGNNYTTYDNGAYRYSNKDVSGKTQGNFYDTGNGHAFYKKNGPEGYAWHENRNQGTRNNIEPKPKSEPKSK